ncbi:MAG: TIGR00645 family protein [Proteobacteria bacterium]|nr:TIGR00645 family protein [Pseudomonadota bacterium]
MSRDDNRGERGRQAEHGLEGLIYASRWLMAPLYLGLAAALAILVITFFRELLAAIPALYVLEEKQIILLVLTLIDISLAGNLVLIILFSGYENFVSKIEAAHNDVDRPEWMGTIDFSGLKIKLVASIVAISAIHLLKIFMNLDSYPPASVQWYVIIHLTFVGSGIGFALMDWIEEKSHRIAKSDH